MKIPGPDHPITIEPHLQKTTITFNGKVVAESDRVLSLKEADYPAVFYIPREDADMAVMKKTSHHTQCPYKGEASYYSIAANGSEAENAVWSYENPNPAVAQIRNYLAFYTSKVELKHS